MKAMVRTCICIENDHSYILETFSLDFTNPLPSHLAALLFEFLLTEAHLQNRQWDCNLHFIATHSVLDSV